MGSTSTRTFSTWAHLPHSNVRRPSTARDGERRESDIADWQFGQRGCGIDVKSEDDSEADMALSSIRRQTCVGLTRASVLKGGFLERIDCRVRPVHDDFIWSWRAATDEDEHYAYAIAL